MVPKSWSSQLTRRFLSLVELSTRITAGLPSHSAAILTHTAISMAMAALLVGGAAIVYVTGGTAFAYPYIMVAIVALGSALYRLTGGIVSAIVAGLLLGPYMPLDTYAGEMQSASNWVVRLLFYIALGAIIGGLFSLVSSTNRKHAQALRKDARTDLANSSALDFDLEDMLRRLEPTHQVQLTFVNLTDLSDILDTLGPDAADEAVKVITHRIKEAVKIPVQLYRFSVADIVLLEKQPVDTDPHEHVQAVEHACRPLFEVSSVPVKVSVCMGTVQVRQPVPDATTVIQRARIALTTAREGNKPFSVYDDDTESHMNDLIRVVTGVRGGLDNNEFLLYFQPKLSLTSMRPVGCEGLIRWQPDGGQLISPGQFMPKVESTHLIDPVTRFVVSQACDFLLALPDDHRVSINFSVRNLFDDELVTWLPDVLRQQQIRPERLEIELTERALIVDSGRAVEVIRELRNHGFHISIDDFGTGYSSFEYLNDLPVSGLKIDRVFVQRLGQDSRRSSIAILKAMIEMGHALDLEVTAEGIEEAHELASLKNLGVELGQGYYFHKPMPAAEYSRWIEAQISGQFERL